MIATTDPGFTLVADRVWTTGWAAAGANVTVIAGEDSAVIVDTGGSPAEGAALRRAAEAVAGVPLKAVALTHAHWDHSFGLAAFADLATYAHASVAADLCGDENLAAAARLGIEVADLGRPQQTFNLAKVIDLGDRTAELVHFGPGHSSGDVVAIVPSADVVVAGDLLEESGPPSFGSDCHLKDWPNAIDGMLGLITDDTVVVPGHGNPVGRMFCFEQRARISAVWGQIEHLIARGVREADALDQGEWTYEPSVLVDVISRVYAEFAAAGVIPRTRLPLV